MVARATKQKQLELQAALRARTRRRWIAALGLVLLVGGLSWQADRLLDVHVKKIQIEGELTASERDAVTEIIAQAITESGVSGLHSLSLEQVRSAVAGLSWADRVSARRRWPDTLVVRLMRHSVVARWGGGGYVATNGKVITPASPIAENGSVQGLDLPLLNCKRASSGRAMEVFSLLNGTLTRAGLRLVELKESDLGEWTAGVAATTGNHAIDDAIDVVLGREDLAARLQRFLAVRKSALRDNSPRFAAVDARYHNGVAVRWDEQVAVDVNAEGVR